MRISDWSSDVCSSDLWTGWRPTHMIGQGLAGKTLGLVGFGRIARATAARARAGFGMTIAYFSRRQADDAGNAVFYPPERKSVGEGKGVSVRLDLGGRRLIKKKKRTRQRTVM